MHAREIVAKHLGIPVEEVQLETVIPANMLPAINAELNSEIRSKGIECSLPTEGSHFEDMAFHDLCLRCTVHLYGANGIL